MTKKLNISKDYILDKNIEATFEMLNTIITTKYNNSKYSTFGNFISPDPPKFILMSKWYSIGRPFLAEIASTKLEAKIYRVDSKSKISVVTKTNLGIFIFFFFFVAGALVKLLTFKNSEDLELSAIYLLLAILTLVFDRFLKNILIERFERDLQIR